MAYGWISVYRQIQNWEIWNEKPFSKAQAWIDLLLLANHKDGGFFVRGIWCEIKKGQIGCSQVGLSEKWGWSRKKLRGFLSWLEKEQMITQQKNNVSSIITIVNYEKFQRSEQQNEQQREQQKNSKGNSKGNTNNNVNNVNNIYNNIIANDVPNIEKENKNFQEVFDLWNSFARKKITAGQIFIAEVELKRRLMDCSFEVVIATIENYRSAVAVENSMAGDWNFVNFIRRGFESYREGYFDLDRFSPRKSIEAESFAEKQYNENIRLIQEMKERDLCTVQ